VFRGVFGSVFQPSFGGGAVAATTPGWWLSGGISASDVAGVWQPKGAASLAASYLRLDGDQGYANIDPAVVGGGLPGVAPGFGANGWVFNGTQYLNSGIVPAIGYSMLARFSNASGDTTAVCGSTRTNAPIGRFYLRHRHIGTNRIYGYGDSVRNISGALTSGVMGLAGVNCYLDGVSDGTIVGSWTNNEYAIFFGASNNSNTVATNLIGNAEAITIYKTIISAAQVAAVSAAMAAL